MSNETNRTAVILLASLLIILMAVVVFLAWAADEEVIERLEDFVQYLGDHRDTAGKLIVTLGALVVVVLALLLIVIEVAPEEEERELRVEQAGATTIVPAEALRRRLEEALVALPDVTAARARVSTRDKGIASALDVTVTPKANVAAVTQEASRVVVDTIQTDLGLPVAGLPTVRIAFGGLKASPATSPTSQPALAQTPPAERGAAIHEPETVDERMQAGRDAEEQATPGSSPDPIVYEAAPPQTPAETERAEGQTRAGATESEEADEQK